MPAELINAAKVLGLLILSLAAAAVLRVGLDVLLFARRYGWREVFRPTSRSADPRARPKSGPWGQ